MLRVVRLLSGMPILLWVSWLDYVQSCLFIWSMSLVCVMARNKFSDNKNKEKFWHQNGCWDLECGCLGNTLVFLIKVLHFEKPLLHALKKNHFQMSSVLSDSALQLWRPLIFLTSLSICEGCVIRCTSKWMSILQEYNRNYVLKLPIGTFIFVRFLIKS